MPTCAVVGLYKISILRNLSTAFHKNTNLHFHQKYNRAPFYNLTSTYCFYTANHCSLICIYLIYDAKQIFIYM